MVNAVSQKRVTCEHTKEKKFVIKDPMLGYILHMNLVQLTWVLFRAIYMHARMPLSLTKTGSRCDGPRFCHSYM